MNWENGKVRLFISHLSSQKALAKEVADILSRFGVHGFVAHADILGSTPWRNEIVEAIDTSEALALFLHEGFYESAWCDQETGIAYAKGKKLIPIRFEADVMPRGWADEFQAHDCRGASAREVADEIFGSLFRDQSIGVEMAGRLIFEMRTAERPEDANEVARVLRANMEDHEWHIGLIDELTVAFDESKAARDGWDSKKYFDDVMAMWERRVSHETDPPAGGESTANRTVEATPLPPTVVSEFPQSIPSSPFLADLIASRDQRCAIEIITPYKTYGLTGVKIVDRAAGLVVVYSPQHMGDTTTTTTIRMDDILAVTLRSDVAYDMGRSAADADNDQAPS